MSTYQWALELAKNGFPVFPLTPRTKTPYAGSRGFKDAFTEPSKVEMVWEGKEHNLGIATGRLVVVDVDPKNGGTLTFQGLLAEGLPLTSPVWVRTGSGGEHHYFLAPKGTVVPCRNGLWQGVDLKAHGGYVVGPGSTHENGQVYELHGDLLDIPELPGCVVDRLNFLGGESYTVDVDEEGNALIKEGSRNRAVFSMLCSMRAKGFDFSAIHAAAETLNATQVEPPLPDWEIKLLVKQASKYKPGEIPFIEEEEPETKKVIVKASELWDEFKKVLAQNKLRSGVSTGIQKLDDMLAGGLRARELTVISAQAKTGKTTLTNNVVAAFMKQDIPCAYASREMDPATQVLPQLALAFYGQDAHMLLKNKESDLKKWVESMPLWFSSGYGSFPLEAMKEWAYAAKARGAQALFMDHLSFMLSGGQQDHVEAEAYIRTLKSLTMELDIAIVCVVQPTKLNGNAIGLETLKGGAAIGQTLDNLICLEAYTLSRDEVMPDTDPGAAFRKFPKEKKLLDTPKDLNFRTLRLDRARNPYCKTDTIKLQYVKETGQFNLVSDEDVKNAYVREYDVVSQASIN